MIEHPYRWLACAWIVGLMVGAVLTVRSDAAVEDRYDQMPSWAT